MLPMWTYAKHRDSNNTNTCNPHIYNVTIEGKRRSKTGVDICWHAKK